MRSLIVLLLVVAAGLLGGCAYTGFYEASGRPVTPIWADDPPPHKIYFPYVLKYPDETMFFIPVNSEDPPHSDLNLFAMHCDTARDGSLVVLAEVRNQGSAVVPAIAFLTGFMGAFRVSAVVTSASGGQEQVDAVQRTTMSVGDIEELVLGPITTPANQVVGIDLVVDPDHVVPDPLRDNNVMSWRGALQGASPQCTVLR